MTYFAARMSFIKKYLTTLEEASEEPIILAEKAIISAPEHVKPHRISKQRKVKGIIDFYIGDILKTKEGRLIAFRISKKYIRPKGTFSDRKFHEELEDHFPPSNILWSAESQIILIERPKKDQMSIRSIINNLQSYLNGRLVQYGYVVLIAQLPYESSFWDLIEKYDTKYSIEFTLFAPNLLDVSSSARDLVRDNKENYNADKTSFRLINDGGNLKIPKDNKFINNILLWIIAGAGRWAAVVGVGNGKKKKISSETNPKTIDADLSKYDENTAMEFTNKSIEAIDEKLKGKNNE